MTFLLSEQPHNPMINAGAILVCSLLKTLVKPEMTLAEKFDYTQSWFQRMAGGENFGFNNSVFLSEREAADRNYALGFYMREHKVFPEKTNLRECLDFYFQVRRNFLTWITVYVTTKITLVIIVSLIYFHPFDRFARWRRVQIQWVLWPRHLQTEAFVRRQKKRFSVPMWCAMFCRWCTRAACMIIPVNLHSKLDCRPSQVFAVEFCLSFPTSLAFSRGVHRWIHVETLFAAFNSVKSFYKCSTFIDTIIWSMQRTKKIRVVTATKLKDYQLWTCCFQLRLVMSLLCEDTNCQEWTSLWGEFELNCEINFVIKIVVLLQWLRRKNSFAFSCSRRSSRLCSIPLGAVSRSSQSKRPMGQHAARWSRNLWSHQSSRFLASFRRESHKWWAQNRPARCVTSFFSGERRKHHLVA